MPRVARIVVPDLPHHVTQRGNNRQDVFLGNEDRLTYLKLLGQMSRKHGLRIWGYCLMSNHVHVVATPARGESLARALGRAHWLYAQYFNRTHGRSGHLWQNRFFSCALDSDHYWRAMRYTECNPLRAGLCGIADDYRWSSAAAHIGGKDPSGLLDMEGFNALLAERGHARRWWTAALREEMDEKEIRTIRLATHTGRPLAGARLLQKLESKLGRRLTPLPVGRPRKRISGKSKSIYR